MKTKLTLILLIAGFICAQSQTWSWSEDYLSYGRTGLSATVMDDSIFYSGGKYDQFHNFSNIIDIYDIGDDVWETYVPETPGRWQTNAVSTNGMVFIAGGNNYPGNPNLEFYTDIDVYSKEFDEWSVEDLSVARIFMGTVAHGNKVFFAGGVFLTNSGDFIYYDVVDIYDTETKTWLPSDSLSIPRCLMGTVAACGKVFFAGGVIESGQVTNRVDIYDMETGEWTIDSLSVARAYIAAVAYEGLVYFAGGTYANNTGSDVIDIYNCEDGTWEDSKTLSESRIVSAHNVYNALVFTGMFDYFNLATYTAYYPNGIVDIYYPDSNQWDFSVDELDPARFYYADVSYDNRVYHAGGGGYSNIINIVEYDPLGTGISVDKYKELAIRVYPNPFTSTFSVNYNLQHRCKVNLSIYNNIGEKIEIIFDEYQQQGGQQVTFNANRLSPGIYYCILKTTHFTTTKKIIKLN